MTFGNGSDRPSPGDGPGLVDPGRVDALVGAIERMAGDLVAGPGGAEALVRGMLPGLATAGDLADTARLALRGSRPAGREIVSLVRLGRTPHATTGDVPWARPKELRILRGRVQEAVGDDPIGPRFVEERTLGLVSAATALLEGPSPEAAGRLMDPLRRQLRPLGALEAVWQAGSGALRGERGALELFRTGVRFLDELGLKPFPEPEPGVPDLLDLLDLAIPADVFLREQLRLDACVIGAKVALGQARILRLVVPYTVTSITPQGACPGITVSIAGSGFGTTAGDVVFPTLDGPVAVAASAWSDTLVEVTVPARSISGDLTVEVPDGSAQVGVCGGRASLLKPGEGARFLRGGTSAVLRLTAEGRVTGAMVGPGDTLDLAWECSPQGGAVTVSVVNAGSGASILQQGGLPSTGSAAVTVPAYAAPATLRCTASVVGACSPAPASASVDVAVNVVPVCTIRAVEVTQGIQTLGSPVGRAGAQDNTLRLAAGKDTYVRVFMTCDRRGFMGDTAPGVFCTLWLGGLGLWPINGTRPRDPSGRRLSATVRGTVDRDRVDDSFNFHIPAAFATGTTQLFVYALVPTPGGGVATVSRLVTVTWTPRTPLRVRWVRIRDDRPAADGGTGTTPTVDEARFTVLRALEVLPTPLTDAGPAPVGVQATTRLFTDDGPGSALNGDIDALRTVTETATATPPTDLNAKWMGLTVPWFRAWGGGPTCVGPIYDDAATARNGERIRMAHELGHTLGFCHLHDTNCSPVDRTLVDVAYDPWWNTTLAGTNHDFMSYTSWDTSWIDAVNWDGAWAAF